MRTQLISVDLEGNITSLRRNSKSGLDLREVGGVFSVKRISEITWGGHGYVINILMEGEDNHTLMLADLTKVGFSLPLNGEPNSVRTIGGVLYFEEYEDAVVVEVAYLEHAKERGLSVAW